MINKIFNERVSCASNVWDIESKRTASVLSLLEVIRVGGRKGNIKKQIESIRNCQDKYLRGQMKGQLPVAMWQGIFQKRVNSGILSLSSILCFDFDKLVEPELNRLKTELMQVPCILAIFRSPSGDGLKVLVKTDNTEIQFYENNYRQIENIFRNHYKVNPDGTCCAISKACYLSYDPDIYVNYYVQDYNFRYDPAFDKTSASSTKTGKIPTCQYQQVTMTPQQIFQNQLNVVINNVSDEQIIKILDLKWAKSPTFYTDGHRHKSIFCQSKELCHAGVDKSKVLDYLKSRFMPTGFNEYELTKIVTRTYATETANFGCSRGQYENYQNYKNKK